MQKRRVVVTGLGTVNPTGNNIEESWNNIKAGYCGIGPITRFDTSDFKVKLAAEVKDFDPSSVISKKEARHMARFTQFAVCASAAALEDAGLTTLSEGGSDIESEREALKKRCSPSRIGVSISCGIGGLGNIEEQHSRGMEKGFEKVSPFFVPMAISNMAAGQVAIRFGLKGMCTCPVTACAGGSNAIGDSFHRIRDGYEEIMVCGGSESCITELGIGGFSNMKALSTSEDPSRASIPFDQMRNGFVMGEGAGILVLEELEHAKARGAHIYCEILGYGANCDAYHITSPDPSAAGASECMRLCLEDGDVSAEEVDYINAHGTSTHLNDMTETRAIHQVFGEHANHLAISSTKSMTGHLLGGAGGVEGVFTVKAISDGFIPATIGLTEKDPLCDLDYVPQKGRKKHLRHALSNSLGFGGHNACLLFGEYK